MRNKIIRIKRDANGIGANRVEVLSDGGGFVVQELPVRLIDIRFEALGPGIVTLELHADLVALED